MTPGERLHATYTYDFAGGTPSERWQRLPVHVKANWEVVARLNLQFKADVGRRHAAIEAGIAKMRDSLAQDEAAYRIESERRIEELLSQLPTIR